MKITAKPRGSRPRKRGFTLIEMLIVVAIVGILIAIAIPALNSAKTDAAAAKKDTISASVETAKNRYALAHDVAGQDALFSQFDEYLLINGETPLETELTDGDLNGVGLDITDWGTYTDNNGNAQPIEWNIPTPPLDNAYITTVSPFTDFSGQNLSYRNYDWSILHSAAFTGANLQGSALTNAGLTGTTYSGANLNGTSFTGSDLTNAVFTGATLLTAAQLLDAASLVNVDLRGTGISQIAFNNAVTAAAGNPLDPKYAGMLFD